MFSSRQRPGKPYALTLVFITPHPSPLTPHPDTYICPWPGVFCYHRINDTTMYFAQISLECQTNNSGGEVVVLNLNFRNSVYKRFMFNHRPLVFLFSVNFLSLSNTILRLRFLAQFSRNSTLLYFKQILHFFSCKFFFFCFHF